MIDENIRELIERELDGETSAEESREIHEYISAHPDARDYFDRMQRLAHCLDTMDEVAPPPGIRENVFAAIEPAGAGSTQTGGGIMGFLRTLAPPAGFRYAAAFAGGVFVAVLGFTVVGDRAALNPGENGALTGTLIPGHTARDAFAHRAFQLPDSRGTVSTSRVADRILVEISMRTEGSAEVEIELAPGAFEVQGFLVQGDNPRDLDYSTQRIWFSHNGEGTYQFLLRSSDLLPPPLTYTVHSRGERVAGSIDTPPAKS